MNWEWKYKMARSRLREALRNQIPVRCCDCKYCKVDGRGNLFCEIIYEDDGVQAIVKSDDFCAWGEKE